MYKYINDSKKVSCGQTHNIERGEVDGFQERGPEENLSDDIEVMEPTVDGEHAWLVDMGATAAFIFTGFPVIWYP